MHDEAPAGAMCEHEGQHYKIGLNGKVFAYRNGDWVSSKNLTASEVKLESEIKRRPKR